MNQDPNFASQDSTASHLSTAEANPGVEGTRSTGGSAINASTATTPQTAANKNEVRPDKISLPPIRQDLSFEERCREATKLAQDAFSQTGSWVVFYREVLGSEGLVRTLFPAGKGEPPEELRRFETTPEFGTLLEMAAALRSQDTGKGDEFEPQKMITVRLPKSQHETLKVEAEEHGTSINKLCISKLLLPIESRFVPVEKGQVRGRKPGPQGSRNQRLSETEKTQST